MTDIATLVGQRFLVGFDGLTAPQYLLDWIRAGRCNGVMLFARNVESPQQVAALTRSLHEATSEPILIAIDQEGGLVVRLRQGQGFTESPGAMAIAASDDPVNQSEAISRLLADEMRKLGINWTFAPVLDLNYGEDNPTVGIRSYGRDPQVVGELAAAAIRGFQSGGVAACAKHFPGLGDTPVDSHYGLPTLDTPLETLLKQDMIPYRLVLPEDPASIMLTHTVYTALDTEHPVTVSPHIIQRLVRDELGFDGIVTTDCMEMGAIGKHYEAGKAAIMATLAGVDLINFSHTRVKQEIAYDALLEAAKSGRVSLEILQASHDRIQAFKNRYKINLDEIDPAAVGDPATQQIARETAHRAIYYCKPHEPDVLKQATRIGLIEFLLNRDDITLSCENPADLCAMFRHHWPNIQAMGIHPARPDEADIEQAKALAEQVDVLIIATRNAYYHPKQKAVAEQLLSMTKHSILIAMRLPIDSDILHADAAYCTHSDSAPSMEAVVEVLVEAQQRH